jgi:hypothetical protein
MWINGENGGVVYFYGKDVILERDAVFDCKAIKTNDYVLVTFAYFNLKDDSTFNQITAVKASPDEEHVHYVNEFPHAKYNSVFIFTKILKSLLLLQNKSNRLLWNMI